MRILGIETSCDETGAAIIEGNLASKKVKLLSNVVTSSLALHAKTGGVIPEVAAREQVKYMIPVIKEALLKTTEAGNWKLEAGIDAIAVTIGPGLVGSLLVGIETAKTLAYAWEKPIIPVNHLIGHIYANFICEKLDPMPYTLNPKFPALALLVSGGHTDLVLMKDHGKLKWLGGTRDDAAGEAFDKTGRLLGLGYPGGPAIAAAAAGFRGEGIGFKVKLPRPMIDSEDFDFSFSGLKTAVLREVNSLKIKKQFNNLITRLPARQVQQLALEVQEAIVEVLVVKTLKAAKKFKVKSILLCGGVAANQKLRKIMNSQLSTLNFQLHIPPTHLCTDNAAMIAAAGFFNYQPVPWRRIKVNPSLHFS